MTIAEFLTARLDEDQAAAERLAEDQRSWTWLPDPKHPSYRGEIREIFLQACNTEDPQYIQFEAGEHIARHDPARVLADIAAKRAIVARCGREVRQQELNPRRYDFDTSERHALRALAAIYSDHTDYSEEWKP